MLEFLVIPHLLLALAFVAGLLMLGSMLRQRRSPQSALAWLGFAILVPYVAVPLFFLLGWRKLRPVARARPGTAGSETLDVLLNSYGVAPASGGNRFDLCTTGVETYTALLHLIESAETSIDVEIFILRPDPVGRAVLEGLVRRASEGIRVRVLLDGLGSFPSGFHRLRALSDAGAVITFFHPLWKPAWWLRANLRNHRKLILVDDRIVLAGGINIGAEYMGPSARPSQWRDLAFLVEGPVVGEFQRLFELDWAYATGGRPVPRMDPPQAEGGATLQLLPSGPDVAEDALRDALLQTIYRADERIWIVTPYFVPDAAVSRALSIAARRGVNVQILVPLRSNHPFADWARGSYLRELEQSGVKVRFFEETMLHAKAVVVDRIAMVGSANMDLRSLFLDYEIMLLIHDAKTVEVVAQWAETLWEPAAEVRLEVGRLRETFEGAVRLLAPLL